MRTHALRAVVAVLLCWTGLGCQNDPIRPIQQNPNNVFWHLSFNHHTTVLSSHPPYNTVTLVATPLNIFGDTIRDAPPATFSKLETLDTAFTLDANGVVIAKRETLRSAIVARLTIDGVSLADTAYLMVRDQVVPLKSFSIQPEPPDSNWVWTENMLFPGYFAPGSKPIRVIALDSTDQPIPDDQLLVAMWPEQTELVVRQPEIYQNVIRVGFAEDTGSAMIYASTFYNGKEWRDSVRLHVIPPPFAMAEIATLVFLNAPDRRELRPSTMTIYAGTTVEWDNTSPPTHPHKIDDLSFLHDDPNWPSVSSLIGAYATLYSGDSVDFVFDHPELVAAGSPGLAATDEIPQEGNIPAWASVFCEFANRDPCDWHFDVSQYPQLRRGGVGRTRSFPIPGTYHYHSIRYPELQGTIIVTDSLKVPPPSVH